MANETLLTGMLELAVPLWIEQVDHWGEEYRAERRKVCSQVVAEKGDIIQFRGGKKGESADAFNHLAEGLALLAFAPGGVMFGGVTWKAGEYNGTGEATEREQESTIA